MSLTEKINIAKELAAQHFKCSTDRVRAELRTKTRITIAEGEILPLVEDRLYYIISYSGFVSSSQKFVLGKGGKMESSSQTFSSPKLENCKDLFVEGFDIAGATANACPHNIVYIELNRF